MHAKDYSLNAVLKERQQWVIPVYQRHYAWKSDANGQLPKLWDDMRDPVSQSAWKFDDCDEQPQSIDG